MNANSNTRVPFLLASISTEEFATFRDNFVSDEEEFEIGMNVEVHFNKPYDHVGVYTRFEFQQEGQPVMVMKCGCHFEFDKSYWADLISDHQITIPASLITHLLVITVGTARGIIHAKKPAWLEKALLPTLDVSGVMQEDMVVNLNQEEEE